MSRPASILLAIALLAPSSHAPDAPKTYELDAPEKPVVGREVRITSSVEMTMTLTFRGGDQPSKAVVREKKESFVGTSEVKAIIDGNVVLARILFTKASHQEDGRPSSYGFEGKAVSMTRTQDGSYEFTYDDGTKLEGPDLIAMQAACAIGTKDGVSAADVFFPGKRVRVGESWTPAKDKLAAISPLEGFDGDKSKATMTLESVDVRDGSEFAVVVGSFDLVFPRLGGVEMAQPAIFHMAIHLDACVDGTRADGRAAMEGSATGVTPPKAADGRSLTVEGSFRAERIVETVK
jgi:hypothetical protein